ncbi:glycosyltransferase family 2 protein [Gaetbulibacter aestuarii]|uniref:Glycosyltransferase family 2 protein n=1 Tax=Gaetbulibacter aestuarii TaxID=1502358 RepID=A0ABW7MV66_9FLAO
MNKSLIILIPVYNELYYTKKCLINLNSTISQYYLNMTDCFQIKIVLIDDGSTDGTFEWVSSNYPDIKILKGDGSLFWSGAINKGIEYCLKIPNVSHVLFWNKDLSTKKDYLEFLHKRIIDENQDIILASKLLRKNDPQILFSYGGLYNPNRDEKTNIGSGEKDSGIYNEKKKIDWCGGMGVTIPIRVFKEVGYCDSKNFPQYDGDVDFFLRAKDKGYKLYAFPDLIAWNYHENTGRKEKFNFRNYWWYLTNIRSFKNFIISYKFLKKHSKGLLLPYLFFVKRYLEFTIKYFTKIVIHVFR